METQMVYIACHKPRESKFETENKLYLNFIAIARENRRDPIFSKLSNAILKGTVNELEDNES